MSNRQQATRAILSFFGSTDRVLLLTGTYQNEKHVLVLSTIFASYPQNARILFRANSVQHIEDFLAPLIRLPTHPQRGAPIKVGRFELYTDTISPQTWRSSPNAIDLAIIYPVDSLDYESGGECVQDILRRGAKKVLLVSWTDNKDFGWVDAFDPVKVIFDAEEERPDYHGRMIEMLGERGVQEQIHEHLPDYASSTSQQYLIKILCRGRCGTARWARLDKPYPGRTAINGAQMGTYRATCLKCGYEATDNYNWYR